MAARDFMPWISADGGTHQVIRGRMNASEVYEIGEPVYINADGEIAESGDDPDSPAFGGLAAFGVTGKNPRSTSGPFTDFATGDLVEFWMFQPGDQIIATTFATDGAGTAAAPAVSNIGDEAGFTLASDTYSIDIGTTSNLVRIVDILNVRKESIMDTGQTLTTADTFYVVAAVVATQFTAESGAAQPPTA